MRLKTVTNLIIILIALVLATGCAGMKKRGGKKGIGAPKNNNNQNRNNDVEQDLRDRINDLERQLQDALNNNADLLNGNANQNLGDGLAQNGNPVPPEVPNGQANPVGEQPGARGLTPGPGLLRGEQKEFKNGLTPGPALTPQEAVRRLTESAQKDVHQATGQPAATTSTRPPLQ